MKVRQRNKETKQEKEGHMAQRQAEDEERRNRAQMIRAQQARNIEMNKGQQKQRNANEARRIAEERRQH